MPDGQGVYLDKDNNFREGYFKHGVLVQGRQILPSGDYFEGQFAEDKIMVNNADRYFIKGRVLKHYDDKTKYDGCFVNGMKEGLGTFTFKNGSSWAGRFWKNKLNGEGIWTYADGRTKDKSFSRQYHYSIKLE